MPQFQMIEHLSRWNHRMRLIGKISKSMPRVAAVDVIIAASIAILLVATSPGPVGAAVHQTLFKAAIQD